MLLITDIHFGKKLLYYTFKGPRLISYVCLDHVADRATTYITLHASLGNNIDILPYMLFMCQTDPGVLS